MTLEMMLAQPVVTRIGWALVHFVWQGALVGGAAAVALQAMRRSSANARYLAACAALCVMTALPVYTFFALETAAAPATAAPAVSFSQGAAGEDATRVSTQRDTRAQSDRGESSSTALAEREPLTPGAGALSSAGADGQPWYAGYGIGQLTLIVGRFAPWLAIAWGACVLALSARFLGGWARVRRISIAAVELAEADLGQRCERMRERVKVTRPVEFLESVIAEVPMVIGWLKPVILLPASVMTNLPAEQLEAIIAHELAHVKRCDYLVNLIQTAVETLLFYHPAVWWVSRRIRSEREHSADDAAAEVCGNRLIYARALAGLEETRTGHGRLAVAASGGTLMERIRRIAGAPSPREPSATGWLGAAIVISIVALAFACALPSREAAKDQFPASQFPASQFPASGKAAKGGHRATAEALVEGGARVGAAGEMGPSALGSTESSTRGAEGVHTATVTADDMQMRGEEILGRMADACSYWLIRPPKTVESLSYDFTFADGGAQHFEIDEAAGAGNSRRQGITYYSPLHAIARDPRLARVGKIELAGNETIEIDFVLDEPFKQHFGTGVENTWRGYMSQGAQGGKIILDAKRFVPISCKTGDVEQTFGEYVEAGAGHYVPRRITVTESGQEGMRWDWRFKMYEGGLWLFDRTGDKSPAHAAASNVKVNGQPAREAAAATAGMGAEAGQTDAVTRIVTEGRTKAEAVIRANRAWLVPSLEARKGLVYEYRQEELYLERVIFDENGNVMAELESTKESPGKPTRQAFFGIDGTKAWASAGDEFIRTERMAGPETATGQERMRCERVVSNLATGLGFESAITKMARGLDDYYADVAETAEKGRFTLLVTWPERDTSIFTGTMLTFSSWAYMHDVRCAKSEIVCESATMRPIEERDYDGEGKLVAVYTYADYLDDITGAAPGRITAVVPREMDGKDNSLEMDARFAFAQPGLWLLTNVTSKFRASAEGSTGRVTVVPATSESTAPMRIMLRRIKATNDLIRGVEEASEGKAEADFGTDASSRIAVRAAWPESVTVEEGEKPIIAAVSIRSTKRGIDTVASTVSVLSTAYWKEYEVAVNVEYLSETGEVLGTGTATATIRTEGSPGMTHVRMGDTVVTGGPVTGGADAVKRVAVTAVARKMTAMYHGHGMWMRFREPAKKDEGKGAGEAPEQP